MRLAMLIMTLVSVALLFLLTQASANTDFFARHYVWLVGLNVGLGLAMTAVIGVQLYRLWRDHREQIFGARLKFRLMLMLAIMALVPGAIIYAVSVQFVTRSIESWFDVRVEQALEAGLNLGRDALEGLTVGLVATTRDAATAIAQRGNTAAPAVLVKLKEVTNAQSAMVLQVAGNRIHVLASSEARAEQWVLPLPTQISAARKDGAFSAIEADSTGQPVLRAMVQLPGDESQSQPRLLEVVVPVPEKLAADSEAVQTVYREYRELELARAGLTRLYAITLTLTLLLALAAAFAAAFILARRFTAPLTILAEGTQAVAAGDLSPKQIVVSNDELGILTQSFNRMTYQLREAHTETERHRGDLERARAYLQEVLDNLSAGVLAFDRRFVLKAVNGAAKKLLAEEWVGLLFEPLEAWPRQEQLARTIRDGFARHGDAAWQIEVERVQPDGRKQQLMVHGSELPESSGGGYVVVFDDITELILAQRATAWGEVARRLAHEIKNPLTPIQLAAERLEHKLTAHLNEPDAEILQRSTRTIVNQVQAMKRMVDSFRDYARLPPANLVTLDLNELLGDMLVLYESSPTPIHTALAADLPRIKADPNQLRQIIHNLIRNAQDATEGRGNRQIDVSTRHVNRHVELIIADTGPGFPPEIMANAFEPYVTTKPKGTGLGLPIVKKIIEDHGGRIALGNRTTGGAEVCIFLQTAEAAEGVHQRDNEKSVGA
ncbi:MAG: HAMP domain-containing protein [Rhodocyclaceae bacterium]|jgi:nitrogen fixation/metabolism regulation signal transduction histidine kinase|nr:HAMP domain-containing protein [Rhodocyclaceae bacterium]